MQAQDRHNWDAALVLLLMLECNIISLTWKTEILQETSTLTKAQELFHRKVEPANPSLMDLFISIQNFRIIITCLLKLPRFPCCE